MIQQPAKKSPPRHSFFVPPQPKLIQHLVWGLTAVILIALIPKTFAATEQLDAGDLLEIVCNGEHVKIDTVSQRNVDVECVPSRVLEPAEPVPTATPTNPTPTPQPTPQPEPSPTVMPESQFGIYPNCLAPAIGVEAHSLWQQTEESTPRQIKMGTCLPNARDNDGGGVIVAGELDAVVRITAVNNPANIEWLRYQWQRDTQDIQPIEQQCQQSPGETATCTWYLPMTINTNTMLASGMDEVNLIANGRHGDFDKRQFPMLSFQLHRGGSDNFRSSPAPLASSWYSGLRYARVHMKNYLDLFMSPTESVPTVSGVLILDVAHSVSKGDCQQSAGYLTPAFDAFYASNASEPVPFYAAAGCLDGPVELDTQQLSNGIHAIHLQTAVSTDSGIHTAAIVYHVNVQNEQAANR